MLKKKRFPVSFFVFLFLGQEVSLAARQCCPSGTYLIEGSRNCSDHKTKYVLECDHGILLLDPKDDESDKFSVESNGSLLVFDGDERSDKDFCLGKIQRNGSEVSAHQVALVCFLSETASQNSDFFSIILRVLMLLSTLFLFITLYVYLRLPNLRDLQGKCVIALLCSLIASYVTLFVVQTFPDLSQEACVAQAAALYFFLSASFFWNNIIAFNIWKAIRNVSLQISESIWTTIYFCWGFGIPFIMVLLAFILDHVPGGNHVRPHFAETKCWFRGNLESWSYFYGPISVLLALNLLMFLQSSWTLWKSYKESSISRIRSLRYKFMMYLKLFLLMGITWMFEVISFATNSTHSNAKYLWFVTDCLNSAEGVLIFLILVVFRQKARLGLLSTKLFGIKWPESWANEEIQESSILSYVDELELSNQKMKMIR